MEFKLRTSLDSIPAEIEFNFEELKSELKEKLDFYNHLVVTEDSIKEAKHDKAKLNKLIKAIENKRKEVKAQCLEPYNLFERKCKELINLVSEPVTAIDTQLKTFDDKRVAEKLQAITEAYKAICTVDYIPLEKILNPKWQNISMSMEDIVQELIDKVEEIKLNMSTLGMQFETAPYWIAIKQCFLSNFDISETLQYANTLKIQQDQRNTPETQNHIEADNTDIVYRGYFEVAGNKWQIMKLKAFMKDNNIQYKILRKE